MSELISFKELMSLGKALTQLAEIGERLQAPATGDGTNAPTAEEKPARRGRGPAKTITPDSPATESGILIVPPPPVGSKTVEELKEIIKFPVEGGKGDKVKAFLTEHGATKISDLAAEHHAAFVTAMKKLTLEVEAEQM